MREYTAVEVEGIVREQMQSDLEKLLREGARQMLEIALQEEVDEYIKQHQEERDEHDRHRVVRNGSHPPRELVTGVGKVAVRQPRVDDRREGAGFTSAILPRYARRSPSIDALIPALYLKGLSTSSFPEALKAILGDHVSGLSPATIVRLKQVWEKEYTVWRQRDLSGKRYAYVWVDGIYFNVRLQPDRPCVLVVVGATHDGRKELLAVVEQQCWVHKTAKVLDKMPKSLHVDAKKMIHAAHQEGGPQGLPTLPGPIRSQVPQGLSMPAKRRGCALHFLRLSCRALGASAHDRHAHDGIQTGHRGGETLAPTHWLQAHHPGLRGGAIRRR